MYKGERGKAAYNRDKQIVSEQQLIQSILNLRAELYEKDDIMVNAREIFFKLNSCLYAEYPHKEHEDV